MRSGFGDFRPSGNHAASPGADVHKRGSRYTAIGMPCLLVILTLLFPRIAILLLYFFTNFFNGVFNTILVPLLGFLFLPLTLLAYTWLTNMRQPVDAMYLVVMFVAVIVDLGIVETGRRRRTGTSRT